VKTGLPDFVIIGGLLLLLFASDAALLIGLSPHARRWGGDYHAVIIVVLAPLLHALLSAGLLRILLAVRPLRPGRYTMDSAVFAWWKVVVSILMVARWLLRPYTFCLSKPLLARLYGARVGRNVAIDGDVDEPFLLTVGDGAILGHGSYVSASVSADGAFTLAPVVIGAGATVGINSVVMAGTTIGDHAALAGGSIAVPGTVIPPGQSWRGNPARKWVATAGPGSEAMHLQPPAAQTPPTRIEPMPTPSVQP
jgi:hypothetical protein